MKAWNKLIHKFRGHRLSSIYGSFDYNVNILLEQRYLHNAHILCVCRHKICLLLQNFDGKRYQHKREKNRERHFANSPKIITSLHQIAGFNKTIVTVNADSEMKSVYPGS